MDECRTLIATEKQKAAQASAEKRKLSQLEKELNEKIADANNRLMQARVDKSTSEREKRFKETLHSLKRIFPGIYSKNNLIRCAWENY
jgi:structural maintenance of chromosome 1